MAAALERAKRLDRLGEAGAVDATGLESRHASRYYTFRRRAGDRRLVWHRWPKLTAACDLASHLFCGAFVSEGPTQDSPQFRPAVAAAAGRVRWRDLFADAGYDAEHNHAFAREALGVTRTVIALNPRNAGRKWPAVAQPYRRAMKRRANRAGCGQRWQIESAFSQHKRVLGSALRARLPDARERETYLRVLTHNLMLLAA